MYQGHASSLNQDGEVQYVPFLIREVDVFTKGDGVVKRKAAEDIHSCLTLATCYFTYGTWISLCWWSLVHWSHITRWYERQAL